MRQYKRAARVRAASLALFGAALTVSEAAHGQTLQDALQSTYATNPQIAAARAELRVVEEELSQAQGGYLPDVGAFAQGTYSDINSSVRADRLRTGEVGVRLRQNLYAGGGTAADVRSATSQIDAQRNILDDTEQGTLLNGVEAFTAVLREQKILDASQGNVERLMTQLDQTERRFSVGEATRTDLAQAQARLIGARADQRQARANLVNAAAGVRAYRRPDAGRPGPRAFARRLADEPRRGARPRRGQSRRTSRACPVGPDRGRDATGPGAASAQPRSRRPSQLR